MICTLFGSSALVSSGMRCLEELGIRKEKNIECSLTVIFGASFNQVAKPLGVIAEGAGFSVKQVLIKLALCRDRLDNEFFWRGEWAGIK